MVTPHETVAKRRRNPVTVSNIPGTSTITISNDGSDQGHRRRKYAPEERLQVADRRRKGACPKCKIAKTKCRHDLPPNATAQFIKDAQRHEMFSLGMTTTSAEASEHKHKWVMKQKIAAIENQLGDASPPIHEARAPQPIGQLQQKATQRKLPDEARKSEYPRRKTTTAIHQNYQELPVSKPGLQGFIKFRLKVDRKTRHENRHLMPKPVVRNVEVDSSPSNLIHNLKTPVGLVPSPHFDFNDGTLLPAQHSQLSSFDISPLQSFDYAELNKGDFASYTELLESNSEIDWDRITVAADSSEPTVPSLQNNNIPSSKLAGNEYNWTPAAA